MVGHRRNQAFAALQPVAGRYAGRVARIWPAPYDGYLGLPKARRHLAHILMNRIGTAPGLDAAAFRREIARLKARDLSRRWAPGAPRGLDRVLAKLGRKAWEPTRYRQLVGFMAQGGEAAKTLRHATLVTPDMIEALDALPERLRGPATMRWVRHAWEARLVAEAVALAGDLDREGARARVLVERLGRARTRARFFAMLMEELRPGRLPAPVAETAELKPLDTVAAVKDAGLRFRNCLADCVDDAAFGDAAFVEWQGAEPAVMELRREGAAGWRLAVLLAARNAQPGAHTVRAVQGALRAQGVRVGMGAAYLLAEINDIVEREREAGPMVDAAAVPAE